jgi:hypothetical protein
MLELLEQLGIGIQTAALAVAGDSTWNKWLNLIMVQVGQILLI